MASAYSDYTYYTSEYHGALDREQYDARVNQAHAEIIARTRGRQATDMEEALKRCECELVDAIHSFAQVPAGVASVNNDGYSVSYGGTGSAQRGAAGEYEAICRRWLLAPTNLLLRWL